MRRFQRTDRSKLGQPICESLASKLEKACNEKKCWPKITVQCKLLNGEHFETEKEVRTQKDFARIFSKSDLEHLLRFYGDIFVDNAYSITQ